MKPLRAFLRVPLRFLPPGIRPSRLLPGGPTSNLQSLRAKLAAIGQPKDQARLIKALGSDLRRFYALVPREGDEYWETIHRGVKALARTMDAGSWRSLPLHHRLMASLVADGHREDVGTALVDRKENGQSFRVDVHEDGLVSHVGYERLIGARFAPGFLTPTDRDLPLIAVLDRARRGADDVVLIDAHAYIGNVDFGRNRCDVTLALVSPEGERYPVDAIPCVEERIDLESRDRYNSYARSAFTMTLDARELSAVMAGSAVHLEVTVSSGSLSRTGPFRSYDDRGSLGLLPATLGPGGAQVGFDAELGLVLRPRTPAPPAAPGGSAVDSVSVDESSGTITVTGHTGAGTELPAGMWLVSRSGDLVAHRFGADLVFRTFTAEFALPRTSFGTAGLAPVSGRYRLVDGTGNPVPATPELVGDFPLTVRTPLVLLEFRRMADSGGLGVTLATPLRDDERGRLNQEKLQSRIPDFNSSPQLVDAVVFACFGGKSVSGSVLALFAQLRNRFPDHAMYWGVRDRSVAVPEGAQAVLLHSREWYEMLHTARILVNNAHFPYYFRKSPGQFYLQTWHGTPLKRIGKDVPSANLSLSYRALMRREADYWDVLLAQNEYARRVLPASFGFGGKTLVEGYPHNDILVGGEDIGRRVRATLGIPEGKTVVLYAPTWRDDVKNSTTGHTLVTYLDFGRAREVLGDDVVFLLRGHINTQRGRASADADGVIDVTGYPDIADLYLAADVLVTDYSSVMFDFCVTGKPMVFLAPDLERYRDATRGFYLDYTTVVPGPIVRSTDEFAEVMRDLPGTVEAYGPKYDDFVQTYAPKDDGEAAKRVIETLFG